ncbi:MAG: tetratricopeptide repeat protein [Bryobacteraceae bacterium]
MLIENSKLLFRVYAQPAAAMSAILDRASLLYASLAVLAVTLLIRFSLGGASFGFYVPLLVLAAAYVPGTLLLVWLIGRLGGTLGATFQRDYSSMLTCTALAWSAAYLPLALASWFLPPLILAAIAVLSTLYFLVLVFFAVRTVFGTENHVAILVVCLSWIPVAAFAFLWGPLRFLLGWIASPFFLFFAYYYLGSEIGNLGAGLRNRQHFRRMLEAAAINPHDAEAQYQLGLIYQQRRQVTEAMRRFQNAIAIDAGEIDAQFQLGRIARQQGRLKDALGYFQTVYDLDDRHSQGEILRELGAVYLTARQYEDARRFLSDYIDRRPYDPEGLYYLGKALEGLNRLPEARQAYERAIEAARTAPRYRRRITAPWSRQAHSGLKNPPA